MLTNTQLENIMAEICSCCNSEKLPSETEIISIVDKTITTLENEDRKYRPRSMERKSGGLLDFYSNVRPVIIVPDLHGRSRFLYDLLNFKINSRTVLSLLNEEKIFVVCVGDGIHCEYGETVASRWKVSYDLYSGGKILSEPMTQEILDSWKTMHTVMNLKNTFPKNFHFLKGNHENILNERGNGNYPFRKFAAEGEMVKEYIISAYGDAVLHLISCFEKSLPLVALFRDFGISHSEPQKSYSRKEIINYHKFPEVIYSFTWTNNDEAEADSVQAQMTKLNRKCKESRRLVWFGGHRPVNENYSARQNGKFIQFHNPALQNVVLIDSAEDFDPEKHIIQISSI